MTSTQKTMKLKNNGKKDVQIHPTSEKLHEVMIKSEFNTTGDSSIVEECKTRDQGCDANIFFVPKSFEKTFICNRYVDLTSHTCDVEILTDINTPTYITLDLPKRKFKSKGCGTP